MARREFLRRTAGWGAAVLTGTAVLPRLARAAATAGTADLAIVEGADYFADTLKAVDLLGGMRRFVPPRTRVGLLINAPGWWSKPGSFTSPEVALAAVKLCADAGARELVLLNSLAAGYWRRSPRAAGLTRELSLVRDRVDEWTEVDLPQGKALKTATVNKALLECDVFLDLPIVKNHEGTGFTGCLKNYMGATSGRTNRFFHNGSGKNGYEDVTSLSQCIADIALVRKPDLCLCDATEFLLTNGPAGPGEIRAAHQVVAGTDPVAVDAYASTLLGLKPTQVAMIVMAFRNGVGQIDWTKLRVQLARL